MCELFFLVNTDFFSFRIEFMPLLRYCSGWSFSYEISYAEELFRDCEPGQKDGRFAS